MMHQLSESLAGVRAFATYLNETGRKARIVDGAPGIPQGPLATDRHLIALEDSPIDLVSIRLQSWLDPWQLLSAPTVSVNGLPIVGKEVVPIQFHWIVRHPRKVYPWLATKLLQKGKGIFNRERVGFSWSGKLVGQRFAEDDVISNAVTAHVRLDDVLLVEPEPDRSIVRIVHKRYAVARTNLFEGELMKLHRDLPSPALLAAFERMAEILETQ